MLDNALSIIPGAFGINKLSARVAPGNAVSASLRIARGFRLEKRDEELAHCTLG
ncbi:hypothetical protein ACT3TP_12225 [Glutamicibacter sp. AOP38-B1-38]|uniref:hypothetical protein n=1 Tax=Glutamicibacter sp. AOP38-B1-38 TaxID=3457680 RepID=UPI00403482FA